MQSARQRLSPTTLAVVVASMLWLPTLPSVARAQGHDPMIPSTWLDTQVSVTEAEAQNPGITDERVARVPAAGGPFGFQHEEWAAMKAAMKPGDQLWTFGSSPESWQHFAGRQGIALVRDGTVVLTIVTRMN